MKCVPKLDAFYWIAIVIASVVGANAGDFMADGLNLGHMSGLPVLAVAFGLVLAAEALLNVPSALYYWVAIIIVRAAATNVGDISHDYQVPFSISIPVVSALLLAVIFLWSRVRRGDFASDGIPVNAFYWVTMFTAGTLGTMIGDWASYPMQLGNLLAAIVLFVPFIVMLAIGRNGLQSRILYFWTMIVLVRSAGTAAGDQLAHMLELPVSFAVTSLVFAVALVAFYVLSRDHVVSKRGAGESGAAS